MSLDEVCFDDLTTKFIRCLLRCCTENNERRKNLSFLFRWFIGFGLDMAEFIYVEALISNTAYETILAIVILHGIFFFIICVSYFRSQKILTLGYVFIFKGLSLSMAVLVFNRTTGGFNMDFFGNLFTIATEKGIARASVAVISLIDICFDGFGLLVIVIYILCLFCTTSKSFADILCLSQGKACCCSRSVEKPEDVIQDFLNYMSSTYKPDIHWT